MDVHTEQQSQILTDLHDHNDKAQTETHETFRGELTVSLYVNK